MRELLLLAIHLLVTLARITAQADKVQELKSVLLRLIKPTRAEEGCIDYELYPSETDPKTSSSWKNGQMVLSLSSICRPPIFSKRFQR
jgi:quinol monooxygenase YgiN